MVIFGLGDDVASKRLKRHRGGDAPPPPLTTRWSWSCAWMRASRVRARTASAREGGVGV
jgi:hypothetical protein